MNLPSFSECAARLDHLAPVMLDTAAKSVMVLGIAGLTALLMRRASAAARHWIWTLGLAKRTVLLPFLSAVLPGWHVLPHLAMNPAKTQLPPDTFAITALPASFEPIAPASLPPPGEPAA